MKVIVKKDGIVSLYARRCGVVFYNTIKAEFSKSFGKDALEQAWLVGPPSDEDVRRGDKSGWQQ